MLHVRVGMGMEVVGACLKGAGVRKVMYGRLRSGFERMNERTKKLPDDGRSPMTEGMDGCSICYS